MRWRFPFLLFVFGALYSLLIFNVFNLQLKKNDFYYSKAEAQQRASGDLNPIRGKIYFTDKNDALIPVAVNKEYFAIYAAPKEIQEGDDSINISSIAAKLSPIVNISIEELKKKLSKPKDQYELLVQKASPEQLKQIKELNLKGIHAKKQLLRYYPFGRLASHLLGFMGPAADDDKLAGRYGAELYFDKLLAGQPGEAKGDILVEPKNGKDLILAIDINIQAQAEETLDNLIKRYQATGGTIIVQEPASGRILAMASYPNFDPNNYSASEIKNFLNPAVQFIYEPGSVFKLFTMAAGIDSGKITPETTYYDKGSVTLNNRTIRNWHLKKYGLQTMREVLEKSINTGAVFAEQKTGHDIFYNYLLKFGLNKLTNIALPGEVKGSLKNLERGRDINFATASFGHGVSVTPIELINAVSAIANRGLLMKPLILSTDSPSAIQRVISTNAAKTIAEMMVSVVEKNVVADIPNYSIAGKTGTAYIPDLKNGGYTDDVINSFAGFFPASDPKFTILIKLDKPIGAPFAGVSVAPAFRELAQFIINYYNIPPDEL